MEMEDSDYIPIGAIVGGTLVMLLVAPKVMLFIAGAAAVVWGINKINWG